MPFFLQNPDIVTPLLKDFGFPITVAIFGILFAWRVYRDMKAKIDQKDQEIAENTQLRREFNDKLITTQNNIINSQNNIVSSQNHILDVAEGIKDLIAKISK